MSMDETQDPKAEVITPAEDVQQNDAPQAEDHGTAEDEAQAFAQGFAQTRGNDDAPAQPEHSPEQGGREDVSSEQDAAVEAAQTAIAGLSSDQLKELLARVPDIERKLEAQMQKVTGKLGEFNRTLQQLQTSGRSADSATARKIVVDRLKRTREMYPDLADAIASDLSEVFNTAPEATSGQAEAPQAPASGPTPQDIARFVEAKAQEAQRNAVRHYEERMLTQRHPDWVETARTAEFKLWAETLPPDDRQKLVTSEDAIYVAGKLDAYKAFREQQANRTGARRDGAQRRLAQAVTPTSGGTGQSTPAQSEEDAFLAGFARARTG